MSQSRIFAICAAVSFGFMASQGVALADGYEVAAPAPVDEGRKFTYSFNLAGTSDYVFRGISQTDNDPTIQGGADFGYGILYAGIWLSGLDFGDDPTIPGSMAQTEIDWYGGIRPVWKTHLGDINFDFGVIYYSYPNANDFGGIQVQYVEFKGGYTWSSLHPQLTTGTTVYYSPDYTLSTGPVWTIESNAAWTFHKVGIVLPVINGVVGWQKGDINDGYFVNVIGTDDQYYYWNAGLNLAIEGISFDFRYWDTNIGGDAANICANASLCDSRFVATVKVVVP